MAISILNLIIAEVNLRWHINLGSADSIIAISKNGIRKQAEMK